jgi:hypothetical protein
MGRKVIVYGHLNGKDVEQEVFIKDGAISDRPGLSIVEQEVAKVKAHWKNQGIVFRRYEFQTFLVKDQETKLKNFMDTGKENDGSVADIDINGNCWSIRGVI